MNHFVQLQRKSNTYATSGPWSHDDAAAAAAADDDDDDDDDENVRPSKLTPIPSVFL